MRIRHEIKEKMLKKCVEIRNKVKNVLGSGYEERNFAHIELMTVLFYYGMNHDPQNPNWQERDRLVVSNLNVLPSLFALMADVGYISWRDFLDVSSKVSYIFKNLNVALVKYPCVDFITDSSIVGMIHSFGLSMLGNTKRVKYRVFHIMQESRSPTLQRMLMTITEQKISNLTAIVPFLDIKKRSTTLHFWFSMGWHVEEVHFEEADFILDGLHRSLHVREKAQVLIG